jgi:heme/copper-type cytochrome/quinol oxidase subunit 4
MLFMKRPQGILITAWIMVVLNIIPWILQYWLPLSHHVRFLNVVLLTLISVIFRIIAFICIFYYAKGRNWARTLVLIVSVLTLFGLFRLQRELPIQRVNALAWALLGIFFLYWLNTKPIRAFFKGASYQRNIENS